MEEGSLSALLQLRVRHLRLLDVIHETGSLRRAAAELCVTQPAVTAMLKDVEQAFGGPLVVRDAHGARLTGAGKSLRIRLGAIMEELRTAATESGAQGNIVRVRVGAMTATMFDLIPATVALLHRQCDGIDVRLVDGSIQRVVGALLADEVDCVVGRLDGVAMDQDARASLQEETLVATPLGVACAVDHPLGRQRRIAAADLAGQDWILLPGGSQTRLAFNQALIQHGLPAVHPVVESESLATNFHTVAASRLLTVAPRSAIALYRRFGIVQELDLDFALAISPVAFICHRVKARLPSIERFRGALVHASRGLAQDTQAAG